MTYTNHPSYCILPLPTRLALAVSLTLCCSAYANTPEQIAHQQILLNEQRQAALNQSLMVSPSIQVDVPVAESIAKMDSVHTDNQDSTVGCAQRTTNLNHFIGVLHPYPLQVHITPYRYPHSS